MYFLPQVCSENLDERDLKGGYFAMHKDASQVELNLEPDIHICPVDCWRPPQGEATIWNLVETRSLGVSQLLVLHGLLEARCLFPEETFPSGEVSALEQSVLENPFHASKCLNHVSSVVVEIPEFAVVLLMRPPERVLLENLVLLEVLSDSPSLVVSQCESVFLEQCIDAWNATVP